MPLLFSYVTLQRDALVGYAPSLVKIEDEAMATRLGTTHHANVITTGDVESRAAGTVFDVHAP